MAESSGSAETRTVIAFDLYGTLLSTGSVTTALAAHFPPDTAAALAALWRRFQLEYTFRLNSMGIYRPFSACTLGALQHALAEMRLASALSPSQVSELTHAYDALDAFPEIEAALTAAAADPSLELYVFSNGTRAMVDAALSSSPALRRHAEAGWFRDLITVDDEGVFKPAPKVYDALVRKVGGCVGGEGKGGRTVWLVSCNPFDVVGAEAAGVRTAWVDREGTGWIDRLGEIIGGIAGPTVVATGVDGAIAGIKEAEARSDRA